MKLSIIPKDKPDPIIQPTPGSNANKALSTSTSTSAAAAEAFGRLHGIDDNANTEISSITPKANKNESQVNNNNNLTPGDEYELKVIDNDNIPSNDS